MCETIMAYVDSYYPFKINGTYPKVFLGKITPRQIKAADSKGFEVLGRGGPILQFLVLGCRACGSPILRRSYVVENTDIRCEGCIRKKDEAAAATIGAELIGPDPEHGRRYREWRLKCGHVVPRQRANIRRAARGDHEAGCETCREQRYTDEAAKFGWSLLGQVPDKSGYRRYQHTCGTVQEASVGNVLWGDIACHKCSDGPSGRPSFIYIFQIDLPGRPVIKFGYSRKPGKRLRHQLGISLDVNTKVLRTISLPSGYVARLEETAAHKLVKTEHPAWVVPKAVYSDAINTAGEIYYPNALPRVHELLDEIAGRYPAAQVDS